MTLKAQKQRCMLASLADGSYFAIGRTTNQKIYRRSYGAGGQVVGIPVTQAGEAIAGAEYSPFPEPTLTMVYPAAPDGGAQ